MSLGRCMAGVTGRWEMRALTNECPSSSSSSSPPPSAPTLAETVQARRAAGRRASAEGRQGRAAGAPPAGARVPWLFWSLPSCAASAVVFPGLLPGPGLPCPAQWSFSSFVRLSLGTPPPSLAFLCSSQSGGATDCFGFWQLVKRFKSVSGSDDITFLKMCVPSIEWTRCGTFASEQVV